MASIELKYGHGSIPLEYDASRFAVLEQPESNKPLTDAEIGQALDRPIDSERLEQMVGPGERVLLVVPDATRQSGSAQVVNLVVRRLIANGSSPHEIEIIIATGIHRAATEQEKRELLTPFIFQRIKTIDHDANDPVRNFRVGKTAGGIPVELNWMLTEFDHVVLIGSVTFHYFAGFTGSRKLICPGLASAKTIEATHKLAFDCATRDRAAGVGPGLLDGNPVHEAFIEAARFAKVSFAINAIVNNVGEVVDLFCGDWITSHQRACEYFSDQHTLTIMEKRDLVIASCGGHPLDLNLIQAHKTLDAAAGGCKDGGRIILVAECSDGLGRSDFLDWFKSSDSQELANRLCQDYQVNGQTAWSLMRKAERFDVSVVTSLDDESVRMMRLNKIPELSSTNHGSKGYILPAGSKLKLTCQ